MDFRERLDLPDACLRGVSDPISRVQGRMIAAATFSYRTAEAVLGAGSGHPTGQASSRVVPALFALRANQRPARRQSRRAGFGGELVSGWAPAGPIFGDRRSRTIIGARPHAAPLAASRTSAPESLLQNQAGRGARAGRWGCSTAGGSWFSVRRCGRPPHANRHLQSFCAPAPSARALSRSVDRRASSPAFPISDRQRRDPVARAGAA
jgi:hypothetical protein